MKLRRTLFATVAIFIVCLLVMSLFDKLPLLDAKWWKVKHTWTIMEYKTHSWKAHSRLLLGFSIPLFFGFPTVLSLAPAIFIWGFWPGIASIVSVHFLISSFFYFVSRKDSNWFSPGPKLKELLDKNQMANRILALYLRLFLSMPCRTTDLVIAWKKTPDDTFLGTIIRSLLGISIRVGIQGIWLNSLLNLLINFRPFPEVDTSTFLFFSAILMYLTIWPRIPELLPDRDNFGEFCLDLLEEREHSKLPPRNSATS